MQQQGAVGMRRVKREMGEGDGSKRKRRDRHEDGNLKGGSETQETAYSKGRAKTSKLTSLHLR